MCWQCLHFIAIFLWSDPSQVAENSIERLQHNCQLLWDSISNGNSIMMFQLQQQTPSQSTTPTWDSNFHDNSSPLLQLNCSLLGESPFQMTTPPWDSNSIADSWWDRLQLIDCQVQHYTPCLMATPTLYSNSYGNSNIILQLTRQSLRETPTQLVTPICYSKKKVRTNAVFDAWSSVVVEWDLNYACGTKDSDE